VKASRIALHPRAGIAFSCFTVLALTGLLPGGAQGAIHTVSYSNGVDPPTFVADGDAADMNPLVDEIEVHFTLADGVNNDWVASGVILATTTDPAGATFVVTNTTIQNITGNQIVAAQMVFDHDFAPFVSLTQMYTAHCDGSFDKVGGGILGTLSLAYSATITGIGLGGTLFMDGLVAAPVLFSWDGLPQHQDTIINQHQDFIFYMDEIDNTINLFNSASILPMTSVGVEEQAWGAIKGLFR